MHSTYRSRKRLTSARHLPVAEAADLAKTQ
jgi:hypothetical protein